MANDEDKFKIWSYDGVTWSERLSILNNGNVGIGTMNPTEKLHVQGTIMAVGGAGVRSFKDGAQSLSPTLYYGNLANNRAFNWQLNADGSATTLWGYEGINWNTLFTIKNTTGNVGIGTTNPTEPLEISSTGRLFIGDGGGSNRKGLLIDGFEDGTYVRLHPYSYGESKSLNLVISPFGGGNVGIGLTNPTEKLTVGSGGKFQINRADNATGHQIYYSGNDDLTFKNQNGGSFIFGSNTVSEMMRISPNGSLGIGTDIIPTGYKLAVAGNVIAEKVKVKKQSSGWPDFVFSPSYKLPNLTEVEHFIKQNQHLPEIPSASEIEKEGQDLGEMNRLLLKKVEELTLYIIKQEKESNEQAIKISTLQKELNTLKEIIKK